MVPRQYPEELLHEVTLVSSLMIESIHSYSLCSSSKEVINMVLLIPYVVSEFEIKLPV